MKAEFGLGRRKIKSSMRVIHMYYIFLKTIALNAAA